MFAVVVPVHNRPAQLERCIASIVAQDFSDWELIVVDDGSTRPSRIPIEFEGDERIRLVQIPHMGASAARNVGIGLATREWVAFCDSDDVWLPHKLSTMVTAITQRPRVGAFASWMYRETPSGVRELVGDPTPSAMATELLGRNVIHAGLPVVVRRSLLMEIGGFDVSLRARQDVDLYVRLAKITPFHIVEEPLLVVDARSADRISANPANRLAGSLRFQQKHSADMTRAQRSLAARRIASLALRTRTLGPVVRFGPRAVGSKLGVGRLWSRPENR